MSGIPNPHQIHPGEDQCHQNLAWTSTRCHITDYSRNTRDFPQLCRDQYVTGFQSQNQGKTEWLQLVLGVLVSGWSEVATLSVIQHSHPIHDLTQECWQWTWSTRHSRTPHLLLWVWGCIFRTEWQFVRVPLKLHIISIYSRCCLLLEVDWIVILRWSLWQHSIQMSLMNVSQAWRHCNA